MINRVVLVGRLTRDPELRVTTNDKKVVEFSLAVDNPFDKENANFFRCKAWGKTAEFVSNYLTKGRLVAVDGRLEQRKWTASDGGNREAIEIICDNVQGLDRPKDDSGGGARAGGYTGGGSAAPNTGGAAPAADEYDPFADE